MKNYTRPMSLEDSAGEPTFDVKKAQKWGYVLQAPAYSSIEEMEVGLEFMRSLLQANDCMLFDLFVNKVRNMYALKLASMDKRRV